MANLLARAPQAHMASDRGVTWHTPTPPPHLYHVPAPSPPDPLQGLLQLQALKSASGNSVFRHTATPPELYRHTPTPPDKHHMRHTPSPGDIKASAALPPVDLYQHLAPSRAEKLRADDLMAYTRVGVDLSLGGGRAANGAATSPAPAGGAGGAGPALSVRDAPTINSLIARRHAHLPHARVDALLERLAPSPVSPHSVIVHSRAAPTPSPPSSNEDSADSCGAPPGSKRKRKPERTVRVAAAPPPPAPPVPSAAPPAPSPAPPAASPAPSAALPRENGDAHAAPDAAELRPASPRPDQPHARRKTRSGSAETIDDIAAMIADTDRAPIAAPTPVAPPSPAAAVTVDKLRSVLASPEAARVDPAPEPEPAPVEAPGEPTEPVAPAAPAAPPAPANEPAPPPAPAAAPRRRSARTSNPEAPNVPVESPSEGKPAEPEASDARTAEPAAVSFVEVENQLEKMFAGLEEEPLGQDADEAPAPAAPATEGAGGAAGATAPAAARKRRRSAPARSERGQKAQRKKADARRPRKGPRDAARDAYDSGSNASSSKSRGPYIQIRGPRDSPLSVSVMNTTTGGEEEDAGGRRKGGEDFRNGVRGVRAVRGLHASTLGLRYDASTPDATWLCAFCQRGPHAASLGDLFGPYTLDNDCDEYRALDEATRRRYSSDEAWFHEACGVWAPGLLAAGARLWGLGPAVWGARNTRCAHCGAAGAALACAARACRARAHLPCARAAAWRLHDAELRALCPRHAPL
uniref:SFRICE_022209 n=1 Tax=Spodoptera frugiperda TaxID=7108 RepID=A0A2H1WR74_SPOFR